METKTWADFGALSKEELDSYTPEDLEALKTSIADNEIKLSEERKIKDDEFAKAKELADNYKIRSEKAELELKKGEREGKESMNLSDIRALNDVHDDDVQEIQDYAKFKKLTVAEAKKTPFVQTFLKERAEERKTALVTQTKGVRIQTKETPDEILEKATQGQFSEKDEDINKLVEARFIKKTTQAKN